MLFTLGAIVPVVPFALASGDAAVFRLLASGVTLVGIGAGITLLTGRSAWRSGMRQLAIGLGAAAVTYGVGSIVGAAV